MIKKYDSYLLKEGKKKSITREDLSIGDFVMTQGECDGISLDYQTGHILAMKEYGSILVEFDEAFSKKLHNGHKRGKDNQCFYVKLDNIVSNNKEESEKIIKNIGEEKKNRTKRLNTEYKVGDIIIGIGKAGVINVDGRVGIVFRDDGNAYGYGGAAEEKKNRKYFIGFAEKFDKNMRADGNSGFPSNDAGLQLTKLNMRYLDADEEVDYVDDIQKIKKLSEDSLRIFKVGEVVVGTKNADGIDFKGQMGIIRNVNGDRYSIQFLKAFHQYLYDVDYMIGAPMGYQTYKYAFRSATEKEIEENKDDLNNVFKDISVFDTAYKIDDFVVGFGIMDGFEVDGQIGKIVKIDGRFPRENFRVKFFANFSPYLMKGEYGIRRGNLRPVDKMYAEEMENKLKNKEILALFFSNSIDLLIKRTGIRIKTLFSTLSYFDITDKNDAISYIPLDKFKRLEPKEDPYKSRFRQQMKLGKFLKMLNEDLNEKDTEKLVNSYKTSYDMYIKGAGEKLKLVSGEEVRFWYNEKNYKTGGGRLNNSCMKGANKGPEMQMFVDNPDVIQMLIMLDDDNKLIGRALIWNLYEPAGGVYMDYVYTRHDHDIELYSVYADQRGWISIDNCYKKHREVPKMVCKLNTDKKYQMGRNALDHFDTLTNFNTKENFLTNDYNRRTLKK